MYRTVALASFALLALCACGAWRQDVYTISPAVKESARRYGDVMDDFADQALLANVLRARDQAPMNFNDLSSITGALSLSGTLGLTFPFGPFYGQRYPPTPLGMYKNTASPSVTGSTSPVINIGTLNTQGFMLTMIQPISSTYVLSKWNEGLDHRLLLYLFVKSIRFCDDKNPNDPDTSCKVDESVDDPFVKAAGQATQISNDIDAALTALSNRDANATHTALEAARSDLHSLSDSLSAATAADNALRQDRTETAVRVDRARALTNDLLNHLTARINNRQPIDQEALAEAGVNVGRIAETLNGIARITPTRWQQCEDLTHPPRRIHANDPDDRAAMHDFVHLVDCLFDKDHSGGGDVDLKSLMILDPLGVAIPFGEQISAQYPAPRIAGDPAANPNPPFPLPAPSSVNKNVQVTVGSEMTIFGTISGLSDGQLHAGNARCPFDPDSKLCLDPNGTSSYVQFYKEYPAQVVLCVNTDHDKFAGHVITPVSEAEVQRLAHANPRVAMLTRARDNATADQKDDAERQLDEAISRYSEVIRTDAIGKMLALPVLNAMVAPSAKPSPGTSPSSGGGAGGGAGGAAGAQSGGGSAGGAGAMSQVTMALIPSRISAIIPGRYCAKDQLVLSPSTEEDFDLTTTGFAHVEWRSIAEVIQYLGALARHPTDQGPVWTEGDEGTPKHRIFEIRKDSDGRISVDYGKAKYSVGWEFREDRRSDDASLGDHSLQSLALLNELISIAKISGTLPVSQPVQVLP
jgi:hypothetical protein